MNRFEFLGNRNQPPRCWGEPVTICGKSPASQGKSGRPSPRQFSGPLRNRLSIRISNRTCAPVVRRQSRQSLPLVLVQDPSRKQPILRNQMAMEGGKTEMGEERKFRPHPYPLPQERGIRWAGRDATKGDKGCRQGCRQRELTKVADEDDCEEERWLVLILPFPPTVGVMSIAPRE